MRKFPHQPETKLLSNYNSQDANRINYPGPASAKIIILREIVKHLD